MKPKKSTVNSSLTAKLKALLATGAMAFGVSTASAANSAPATAPANDLQARLERVRQEMKNQPIDAALQAGDGTESAPTELGRFWRNWGNGGWGPRRNWGNGWPNWPNWSNWNNAPRRGPSFWANF